jgi:hypothetical protein
MTEEQLQVLVVLACGLPAYLLLVAQLRAQILLMNRGGIQLSPKTKIPFLARLYFFSVVTIRRSALMYLGVVAFMFIGPIISWSYLWPEELPDFTSRVWGISPFVMVACLLFICSQGGYRPSTTTSTPMH